MFHDFIIMWLDWVKDWGYWGVIVLMAMESSIFPVPSEVVIPPAAIMAAQGHMSYWGVILSGTFGSWLGSAITYWVSLTVGRPLVMKYGKFFFMPPAKVERAEVFLQKYQLGGIFFARLLPVIRHLISIPAGLVKMSFLSFSIVTTLGAFIWCWVLAWYGFKIGKENPGMLDNPDALIATVKGECGGLIVIVATLCVLYFLMLKLSSKKEANKTERK